MTESVAHQLRAENRDSAHEEIMNRAKDLVQSYINSNPIDSDIALSDYYQDINTVLEETFDTPLSFQLARRGFLEVIRLYNKRHNANLDEPVVPVLAKRDSLSIDYDWFVQGSEVSRSCQHMIRMWQNETAFTINDLIESAIFCSIVYGGLNDIKALKAFYEWLLTKRELYRMDLAYGNGASAAVSIAVILLSVQDGSYGCYKKSDISTGDISTKGLSHNIEYIPDDMTLCFLYALKNKDFEIESIKAFDSIIDDICEKLNLKNKDRANPHLSQIIQYANYHWRQIEGSNIDGALAMVKQGNIKSTGLPINKLRRYNHEAINQKIKQLEWSELFDSRSTPTIDNSKKSKNYPTFSKNLVRSIHEALKSTRASAVANIEQLQRDFPQPNAMRLLGWVAQLLSDKSLSLASISKYAGCIGRDWLMLTLDEDLDDWNSEDFEVIYEQIIYSKIEVSQSLSSKDEQVDSDKISSLDKYKDAQKFTYGRLRAFHDYQRQHFDAPYVYFPWGNNRQVVKANIVSPRIYRAMKAYINNSALDILQKTLCLVVLSLAYRTGMRLNELVGIKVSDIADIYTDDQQVFEQPKIWLRPNRYRKLKSSSASRVIPIDCLLKSDEMQQFIDLYCHQKRLKRDYLFSQGSGKQPLPNIFFSNMMKLIWDRLLKDHDFTFHSFRHTAISQLALVLRKSPLAQVMTDYNPDECDDIIHGIIGYHKDQGAWFGLASFAGHLTCDTTFEHYIHTAHLLAGTQLLDAKLQLPYTFFEKITGMTYQTINSCGKDAYDAKFKQVNLSLLRSYLVQNLIADDHFILSTSLDKEISAKDVKNSALIPPSIFIHQKYSDAIAFLEELQKTNIEKRDQLLPEIAIRHGINLDEARQLYNNANQVFGGGQRLLLSSPRGRKNQELLIKALEEAYQMSIYKPDQLMEFVNTFANKQNLNTSTLHFGIKSDEIAMLKQFLDIGCQLINASYWQIRASDEVKVTELKQTLKLNNQIRIGSRQNFHGYEVRVVQKKRKRSDKNLAKSDHYYASSGVLKYLGYVLLVLTYKK